MMRILPRDAFNDANLLKCIGQLTLLIEEGLLPKWKLEYDGEPFDIQQDPNSGSTYVSNIQFEHDGNSVFLSRPVNSREAWPLYLETQDGDCSAVFDKEGNVII